MSIYLIVKSGPSQGETYQAAAGLLIGRSGAQIRLNDAKVSSEHARIYEAPEGGFELRDLGSKNGIIVKDQAVKSLILAPGTEFLIGETLFQVMDLGDAPGGETPKKKAKKRGKRWNEVLSSFLRKSLLKVENVPKKLRPMTPALVLDFVRGPQAETRWILGYGPRSIGKKSLDYPLWEEGASDICFNVEPTEDGIRFHLVGKEVLLNGASVSSEILKIGDRIQVLGTEMEVDFVE